MFLKLLLLMTVVPAIELFLLIKIGETIGAAETVLIILLTGTVGAALAKREGLGVIRQLQADLQGGLPPASRLVEGILVLIGGALLVTPGVLTDVFGFSLILPWSRRWLAPRVKDWVAGKVKLMPGVRVGPMGPGPAAPKPPPTPAAEAPNTDFEHPVS